MQVLRREQLSPNMVRLIIGGTGFDSFEPNGRTDAYCKIDRKSTRLNSSHWE